ncbi:MAG: DUF4062 domain-containing protein [Candidatus Lokiarchaeota archaeon]|nr:DUF4062 domain-containing protein [Candidatus Lokiarchaeota archaeon]
MAKPRIFLSSTFYDLRYIRTDLERFIQELGYEPVLNERGQIPYGKSEPLEQYCYREISTCDIVVHIIGGTFGSNSSRKPYSISQVELKTAHELNKQIYIFIEKPVHVEYRTYLLNEKNENFHLQYVDDNRIYKFIKEVYSLGINNVIADFETVSEIINYLREQWAGLFQRFLQEDSKREDYKVSNNLKVTAETLSKLIQYIIKERDSSIKSILLLAHPLFEQVTAVLNINFKIIFETEEKLFSLFKLYSFERIQKSNKKYFVFERIKESEKETVTILRNIFDAKGKLKQIKNDTWNKKIVSINKEPYDKYHDII